MDLTTKNNIRPFFSILILFVSISLFNIPVLETLWRHSFDDGTYSHAYLIPFITFYLYFQLSKEGRLNYRNKLSIPFTLLFIFCCYLLFITTNAQISIGYWFSFLLVCITSILMLFRYTWHVVFPTAFLIFILPFWGILVPLLQNLSVLAVEFIMSYTGIPTFVEAQTITIPAGVFEIAGGCSGLRYLLVSLAISSMFIFLYINNIKKSTIFFLVAVLGALLTNWIRITLLIVIGEYSDMQSSLMRDHNNFGWYLYIPFMFLLFKWGNRLADNDTYSNEQSKEVVSHNIVANKMTMMVLIMGLMLSSTSILSRFTIDNIELPHKAELNENNLPKIFNIFSTDNILLPKLRSAREYKVFHFNVRDLDSKPTFFYNNVIPAGWSIRKEVLEQNWHIYHIENKAQNAVILTKFEIDGQVTNKVSAFKLLRITKALKGINKTKLHWAYAVCENNCENQIKSIINL